MGANLNIEEKPIDFYNNLIKHNMTMSRNKHHLLINQHQTGIRELNILIYYHLRFKLKSYLKCPKDLEAVNSC